MYCNVWAAAALVTCGARHVQIVLLCMPVAALCPPGAVLCLMHASSG